MSTPCQRPLLTTFVFGRFFVKHKSAVMRFLPIVLQVFSVGGGSLMAGAHNVPYTSTSSSQDINGNFFDLFHLPKASKTVLVEVNGVLVGAVPSDIILKICIKL